VLFYLLFPVTGSVSLYDDRAVAIGDFELLQLPSECRFLLILLFLLLHIHSRPIASG
jgi:hypothetical protein